MKNNLTQSELGEKINVGKTAIANYESGYSEPKIANLITLANLFKVSLDYLMGRSDNIMENKIIIPIDVDTSDAEQKIQKLKEQLQEVLELQEKISNNK